MKKISREDDTLLDQYVQAYFEGDQNMGVKIADMYYETRGISVEDYETAHNLYLEAANLGNIHAMTRLVSLITEQKVANKNSNLSDYWNYRSQEANGDQKAALELGRWHKKKLMEYKESGRIDDYYKALEQFQKSSEWYEKAIMNKNPQAMYEASQLYQWHYPLYIDYARHHARTMESITKENEIRVKFNRKGLELSEQALKHGSYDALFEKLREYKDTQTLIENSRNFNDTFEDEDDEEDELLFGQPIGSSLSYTKETHHQPIKENLNSPKIDTELFKSLEEFCKEADEKISKELFAELGEEYIFSSHKEINNESKGKELIKKGIAAKDPFAYYIQGRVYEEKRNDKENAIVWYERAADCDNTKTLRRLGDIYTELDERKNDLDAIKGLWYYLRLYTFEKNEENLNLINNIEEKILNFDLEGEEFIFKSWCKAAINEDENSSIMADIGKMYMSERCIIDYNRAYRWFNKAMAHGETRCLNDMGCLFRYGLGVEKDEEKAYEFFDKSSMAGDASGIKNKADLLYKKGKFEESKKMYTLAAEKGDVEATRTLRILFNEGTEKELFNSQYTKAEYQLNIFADICALDIDNKELILETGMMYEEGIHCSKDVQKAHKLYRVAADKSSTIAKRKLAKVEIQDTCDARRDQAIKYLEKEGKNGDVAAMEILAEYYDSSIRHEPENALQWYEKAIQNGNTKLISKLGKLYFDTGNFDKAYNLCIQQTNNRECYVVLGYLYSQGFSQQEKDNQAALRYFEKAAHLGSLEGRNQKCLLRKTLDQHKY